MQPAPNWNREELEEARQGAIQVFKDKRLKEPLEAYLNNFDDYLGVIEDLFEITIDLTALHEHALDVLTHTNKDMALALRYIPGPPISEDDLKVLADAVLTKARLKADEAMVKRLIGIVLDGLDRRRFPWISEDREPSEAERKAAITATAALMAMRKVETARRHDEKKEQEEAVEAAFIAAGLSKVPTRHVGSVAEFPNPGEFCRESTLGTRKADFILRLWDNRVMPIECKVSNSFTNSVKRLNNDAAAKAVVWREDFGARIIVPVAVLSGVYKLGNLEDAQNRGLSLFWGHALNRLTEWIANTRPQGR